MLLASSKDLQRHICSTYIENQNTLQPRNSHETLNDKNGTRFGIALGGLLHTWCRPGHILALLAAVLLAGSLASALRQSPTRAGGVLSVNVSWAAIGLLRAQLRVAPPHPRHRQPATCKVITVTHPVLPRQTGAKKHDVPAPAALSERLYTPSPFARLNHHGQRAHTAGSLWLQAGMQ